MPQDYEKLDTAYGSEADLRRCVAALRRRGLKALADVVINHRCAQEKVLPSSLSNSFVLLGGPDQLHTVNLTIICTVAQAQAVNLTRTLARALTLTLTSGFMQDRHLVTVQSMLLHVHAGAWNLPLYCTLVTAAPCVSDRLTTCSVL